MTVTNVKDLALLTLGSARLSRLVITDKIGEWWIKDRVHEAASRHVTHTFEHFQEEVGRFPTREEMTQLEPWWWKYLDGLECPFCIGFWLGAGNLTAYVFTARSPRLRSLWRFGNAALALNYVTAHLGGALGDFDEAEDEDEDKTNDETNVEGDQR